jgi:hypothetical protein
MSRIKTIITDLKLNLVLNSEILRTSQIPLKITDRELNGNNLKMLHCKYDMTKFEQVVFISKNKLIL